MFCTSDTVAARMAALYDGAWYADQRCWIRSVQFGHVG